MHFPGIGAISCKVVKLARCHCCQVCCRQPRLFYFIWPSVCLSSLHHYSTRRRRLEDTNSQPAQTHHHQSGRDTPRRVFFIIREEAEEEVQHVVVAADFCVARGGAHARVQPLGHSHHHLRADSFPRLKPLPTCNAHSLIKFILIPTDNICGSEQTFCDWRLAFLNKDLLTKSTFLCAIIVSSRDLPMTKILALVST
jgi:hypothetical protein